MLCVDLTVGCGTSAWIRFDGVRTGGGTRSTTSTTEDTCLNECTGLYSCVSVDVTIAVSPLECYIHTNVYDLGQVINDLNYRQYILINRCSNCKSGFL